MSEMAKVPGAKDELSDLSDFVQDFREGMIKEIRRYKRALIIWLIVSSITQIAAMYFICSHLAKKTAYYTLINLIQGSVSRTVS